MSNPMFGELVKVELEACLDAPIARYFDAQLDKDPDVLAQLLATQAQPQYSACLRERFAGFFSEDDGLAADWG